MNKKAIWAIIGLMSIALIGIVLLQMYWIRISIQEKQEKFTINVTEALNRVSIKLEAVEDKKNKDFDLEFNANGFDEYNQSLDGIPKVDDGLLSEKDRTRRYKE